MFGINGRSGSDSILTLQISTNVTERKERTTITRNRNPRGRRRAGMNLYHRADQFLMRLRISEGLTN